MIFIEVMIPIPPEAWAALADFAPARLLELQARFEATAQGSDEQASVMGEIGQFINEFKVHAMTQIAEKQSTLARIVELKSIEKLHRHSISQELAKLFELDMTWTEYERLIRIKEKLNGPLEEKRAALEVLDLSSKKGRKQQVGLERCFFYARAQSEEKMQPPRK